jgi:hypothetical protein
MKVVIPERYLWTVNVTRVGSMIKVYLIEDIPEAEFPLTMPRTRREHLVPLKRADRVIERARRECDTLNAESNLAEQYLQRLARDERAKNTW